MILEGPPAPPPKFESWSAALAHAGHSGHGVTFVALDEQETPFTWAEVHARARRAALRLREWGVAPGERVAILTPTSIDFLDAFFGALLCGAVPVPLYPPVRLGRLEEFHAGTARMLQACGARLVLATARVKLLLGQAISRAQPPLGCRDTSELQSGAGELDEPAAADALAVIQFSSGTTVDPKPVALTQRQLLTHCAALERLMPYRPGDLGVSWLPLYHDMGLIGCLLSAVSYPGPLVLIPPEAFLARPALWLRALSRHRGTVSPAPNFAFALCAKRIRDEDLVGVDLSSWRYALDGAEPIAAESVDAFCERFSRHGFQRSSLLPVYGLSEASLAVSFSSRDHGARFAEVDAAELARSGTVRPGARRLASVGVPVPGVSVSLRGDGGELAEGQVGRILIRGPSVMAGYFQRPDATAAAIGDDGWLDTGDLGFIQSGELFVCGRAKDLVIVRGANHTPQEFEEALSEVPGVRPGCAVAVGALREGRQEEELILLVERLPAASPELASRIGAAVVARTGIRPAEVLLLDPGSLPRTSSGKLRRQEARRRYLAGELTAPAAPGPLKLGAELVRSALGFLEAGLKRE